MRGAFSFRVDLIVMAEYIVIVTRRADRGGIMPFVI